MDVEETTKMTATLQILSDAVARIKRTGVYYTQLDTAKADANNGKYINEQVGPSENLLDNIEYSKDANYRFEKFSVCLH